MLNVSRLRLGERERGSEVSVWSVVEFQNESTTTQSIKETIQCIILAYASSHLHAIGRRYIGIARDPELVYYRWIALNGHPAVDVDCKSRERKEKGTLHAIMFRSDITKDNPSTIATLSSPLCSSTNIVAASKDFEPTHNVTSYTMSILLKQLRLWRHLRCVSTCFICRHLLIVNNNLYLIICYSDMSRHKPHGQGIKRYLAVSIRSLKSPQNMETWTGGCTTSLLQITHTHRIQADSDEPKLVANGRD